MSALRAADEVASDTSTEDHTSQPHREPTSRIAGQPDDRRRSVDLLGKLGMAATKKLMIGDEFWLTQGRSISRRMSPTNAWSLPPSQHIKGHITDVETNSMVTRTARRYQPDPRHGGSCRPEEMVINMNKAAIIRGAIVLASIGATVVALGAPFKWG